MNDYRSRQRDVTHHIRRTSKPSIFSRIGRNTGGPRRRITKGWKKILSWALIVGLGLFFVGSIAMVGMLAWVAKDLPDPNNIIERNVAETTTIYDRTGTNVLYQIHGEQKRTVVKLEDISPFAVHATITAEDRDFYTHGGFDPKGMLRALYRDIFVRKSGQNFQGGSTITQQFIKKSVLNDEQTLLRKVKELILSLEIEQKFTKDQILQLYLNEIPYGSVSYGIESASQTFLGKSAKDLTLSEAALLASLPKGPSLYSPYGSNTELLVGRQQYIIDTMAELGYVTKSEAEAAKKDDVLSRIKPKREAITAPHFVFYVKQALAEKYGDDVVERGGLKVITTLDFDKQKLAEEAIADGKAIFTKWKANTAAMTSIDARSGDILAMVGSPDFFDDANNGQYNSLLGRLQPGSSIKPMVYAAAFEKGFTPSTVVDDVKTEFSTSSQSYSPNDYDLKERGPITLKEALAGSLNIPAVKVLYLTGFDKFEDFAKRVGYTTFTDRRNYGLSLVLGGAVVKPLEHINAYTAFAQDGVYVPSRAILKVSDHNGKVLEDHTDEKNGKKAMEPEIARLIDGIMSDNAARAYVFGEKNYLTLPDRPVAAKTGTTNNNKDAWTVGFTPSLVTGVWVGNSKGESMKAGADGSIVAAPIWNQYMKKALAGKPVENFPAPQPIVTGKPVLDGDKNAQSVVKIDRASGKLATDKTPPELVEERRYGLPHSILFFIDKEDPRGPAPEHPENDPQFANWEKAILDWSTKNNVANGNGTVPTEYDDVHTDANRPTVSFVSPSEGATLNQRTFVPQVTAYAPRGVAKLGYYIDDELIGTVIGYANNSSLPIPNHVTKGFHTLSVRAYDDVGNVGTASVTINVTAEIGPVGIEWTTPYNSQNLSKSDFPFTVSLRLDDRKSIVRLAITAVDESNNAIFIGSLANPALPNLSFTWNEMPKPGRYNVTVTATLTSGDETKEVVTVFVR